MMPTSVIDAFPPNTPGKRPICQGKVGQYTAEANERKQKLNGQRYLRSRRGKDEVPPDQCDFNARYLLNGKWLCRKHAAYMLLDSLAVKSDG